MGSKKELMDMLGIKPEEFKKNIERTEIADMGGDPEYPKELALFDTSLACDDWEREQGERLAKSQHNWHLSRERTLCHWADFSAAAFRQQPEIKQQNRDFGLHHFLETLLQSPDFHVLHQSTAGNVLASDMAAKQFADQFLDLCTKYHPENKEIENEVACIRAVGQAVKEAQAQVDQLEEMGRALGCSEEVGQESTNSSEETLKLFHQVKNNQQLRRIMELAGRYRRTAQAKQRQKVSHGYDDMIGTTLDGDVGRLLPLERVMLADDLFELDAMRRLVERQSMCREYRGIEKLGKGPIVVCVDESGSMNGEPLAQAKAFALAMYWIAKHQKRQCILVSFSGGSMSYSWNDREVPDLLVKWLEHNFNGGTTLNVPLIEVPSWWGKYDWIKKQSATDLIIITDGIVPIPSVMKDNFLQWKKANQVKTFTFLIGCGEGQMREVSDEIFKVSGVSVDSDAVSKCFSI